MGVRSPLIHHPRPQARSVLRLRDLLILCTLLALAAAATAVPVTFRVRMAQQIEMGLFDPATEFVDVAGTFNGWGGDPMTPLADADGDSIYDVTVAGFTPGETIEYKFRFNGAWDGREEFPGYGSNRVYTVLEDGNEILVWYDDLAPGGGHDGSGELYWWNDVVFYEVFVRSFQDSDGDGIGDFQGLTQRLDHLQDLGVGGLWLMPINDSPSYHGYDAVDYRALNPDYGTMADFQAFLAEAHARGMKVIVDYVMNHCSDQHPWFQASAAGDPTYRDWYRWSPADPGQTGPWGQNVWHWNSGDWFYGLFWSGMPDLNYAEPAVKTEMFDTAAWWLDTVGVDGFRLDAVLYLDEDGAVLQNTAETLQLWQDFGAHVRATSPDALTVGEAWTSSNTVVQYVIDDRLDLCFEFDQAYAIVDAVNAGDAGWLRTKTAQVYELYPYLQYASFLTNHDQNRLMESVGFHDGRARAAAAVLLTLPGVPFLYYGEEIGMVGSGAHENIRTPMQWTPSSQAGFTTGSPWWPVNGDYATVNVETQGSDPGSLLSWYRDLIAVRNESPALRRGDFHALAPSDNAVLSFLRSHDTQTVVCAVNTSSWSAGAVDLDGVTADVLPAGEYQAVNLLDTADVRTVTVDAAGTVTGIELGGHEAVVYALTVSTSAIDAPPSPGPSIDSAAPNPFNPSVRVVFTTRAPEGATATVHDSRGRRVARLATTPLGADRHEAVWDGCADDGRALPSGVYVVMVSDTSGSVSDKVTLAR